MGIGIEKINLYAGPFFLDMRELSLTRGKDPKYVADELMCEERAITPLYEDAVTLAVNAADKILTPADRQSIELVIVGTESAVDFGKPLSTWVHRFSHLPANCRNFEVKHACYGGTAALKMAAFWVGSGIRPGKKALVISTDLSRAHMDDGHEFATGGCAVAMLVSTQPDVLEIPLEEAGYWTHEISDTFRPTSGIETGNNEISLYSYLDAMEGAYADYERKLGPIDYDAHFKKHIYHAPFPGMACQAHRMMLGRSNVGKLAANSNFQSKVQESLYFARRIGGAYGSSNFVCLLGLLASANDIEPGDRISLFAYGSGCQSEFYSGVIGARARDSVRALEIDRRLDERVRLSVEQYELIEYNRQCHIDSSNFEPRREGFDDAYRKLYKGKGLLVLKEIKDYCRQYERS